MQMAITFMAVVAGLIFSIAVALLAEELIFGQVFRLFFGPAAVSAPRPQSTSAPFRGADALRHPNTNSAQ
jgi:membrane protein implicated in regulation of membrane protease activity